MNSIKRVIIDNIRFTKLATKSLFVKIPAPFYYGINERVCNPIIKPSSNAEYIKDTYEFGNESSDILINRCLYGYYIKPTKPCFTRQFEEFFGLGYGNYGFEFNNVVYIPYIPTNKTNIIKL